MLTIRLLWCRPHRLQKREQSDIHIYIYIYIYIYAYYQIVMVPSASLAKERAECEAKALEARRYPVMIMIYVLTRSVLTIMCAYYMCD